MLPKHPVSPKSFENTKGQMQLSKSNHTEGVIYTLFKTQSTKSRLFRTRTNSDSNTASINSGTFIFFIFIFAFF